MGNFGALYIAIGKNYQHEALRSLRSLRYFNPRKRAAIVAEADAYGQIRGEFDEVISIGKTGFDPYTEKVRALSSTPFDTTMFLDTDTHIRGDITDLAGRLDHDADFAATGDGSHYPGQINTGVLLYHRLRAAADFSQMAGYARTLCCGAARCGISPRSTCEYGYRRISNP